MGVSSVSIERRKQAFMMWLLALLLCVAMPFSAFSQIAMESCYASHELDYGGKRTTAGKVEFASYLFDASDDCKNQLAREDILKRDREGCDDLPTAIKTIKGTVGIEEPQKVVTIINSVCLDALKELSYEEIIKLIKVIAKQPKLKEDSELAIIRLINAINSNKYGDFFRVLEESQNELIKYLVEQIDDASLCFWYGNNYTNFIGALVKMCQSQTTSYLNKIPEAGDEKLLGQVLNVYNQPFKNDLPATGIITGVVSMNEFTFCGIYDKDRGTIDIERKKLVINPAVMGSDIDNRPQPEVKGTIVATGLSPLTPIIYTTENELPLVATALDIPADTKAHQYIVPAIFLKYKGTKEFNDAAERSGMIVLDAVTIAASGSAALATKVNWVKRIWALSEVVGAIGNIGVNTQTINSDSYLSEAIEAYNLTMGAIGIKNTTQSGYRFIKSLNPKVLSRLKNNQEIRDLLKESYLKFKSKLSQSKALGDYDNLDNLTKQNISQKETVFNDLLKETKTAYRKFTEREIDEYVKQATQYPEREKVMLGKYERNSPNSYEKRANNAGCTYFEFKKWDDVYAIVGNNDEMWRINKEFILRQKQLNKEFYFSHDPKSPIYATGFYKREIDLLTSPKDQDGLGGVIETIIEGKLWKVKF